MPFWPNEALLVPTIQTKDVVCNHGCAFLGNEQQPSWLERFDVSDAEFVRFGAMPCLFLYCYFFLMEVVLVHPLG